MPPAEEGWRIYSSNAGITVFINTYDKEDAMSLTEDELASCLVLL